MTVRVVNSQASTPLKPKLNYLIKECCLEMKEMKSELFDIQNTINKCRSSLMNLNMPSYDECIPTTAPSFRLTSNTPSFKTSSPYSKLANSFDLAPCKRIKNLQLQQQHHNSESICLSWPSSLVNDEEDDSSNYEDIHSISIASSTNLDISQSSYDYPSTSIYNQRPNKSSFKTRTIELSKQSKQASKSKKSAFYLNDTPLVWSKSTNKSHQHQNRPTSLGYLNSLAKSKPSKNKTRKIRIRIYNHNNETTQAPIENKRDTSCNLSNINYENKFKNIQDENDEHKSMIREKSCLLKHNSLSPIISSNASLNDFSLNNTNTLKEHFIVVNHKNNCSYETTCNMNASLFEPQIASTPTPKEFLPKTSTPNIVNTSYMDQILTDLLNNNHQINQCLNYKLIINENAKRMPSSFMPSNLRNTHMFNHTSYDDENNYDVPSPHLFIDEYRLPNSVYNLSDQTIDETKNLLRSSLNINLNSKLSNPNHNQCLSSKELSTNEASKKLRENELKLKKSKKAKSSGNETAGKRLDTKMIPQQHITNKNVSSKQKKKKLTKHEAEKNLTITSHLSSYVTTSIIDCCIRPFKNFVLNRNLKKVIR